MVASIEHLFASVPRRTFVRLDRLGGLGHTGLAMHARAHLPIALAAVLGLALGPLTGDGVPLWPAGDPATGAGRTTPTRAAPGVDVTAAQAGIRPRIAGIAPLSRQVYGYLPYWRLDAGTVDRIRYDLVSTIAFFGLGIVPSTGAIDTSWRGYGAYVSDAAAAVTNAAHDQGVRVVPTFQLFDSGTLAKVTAFLGSPAAQDRFIAEALALIERRGADGASLDFEPMPLSLTPAYLAFVGRFSTALRARFPGATLVNATSAGAPAALIAGLVPLVDAMFVMTYNYRWSGSTVAGAVAPLDNTTRTVTKHISKFLTLAPASKIILGVPYYGYDWPVTSDVPNATVQPDRAAHGGVHAITYRWARDFLAAHPEVERRYDAVEGSAFFTYWSAADDTFRQVYVDDEGSLAAKYDFAIAMGLAGVGIWTLDSDRGYTELWDVLRVKFYAPVHSIVPSGVVTHLARRAGWVVADVTSRASNRGTVPEVGTLRWVIRDGAGRVRLTGARSATVYPGRTARFVTAVRIGRPWLLPAGTYTLTVSFRAYGRTWRGLPTRFRQPY